MKTKSLNFYKLKYLDTNFEENILEIIEIRFCQQFGMGSNPGARQNFFFHFYWFESSKF